MTTPAMETVHRRDDDGFRIHEDAPRTEDTEMMVESEHRTEDVTVEDNADDDANHGNHANNGDNVENAEAEDDDAQSDTSEESSGDINKAVQEEMDVLSDCFPEFRDNYRLIKRIGEGGCRHGKKYKRSQKLIKYRNLFHRLQSRRPAIRPVSERVGH